MTQALPVVYLVRHADTAWTLTGQHTGRPDLPLTEQGQHQARELGASLTALRVDRILSSPLQRARGTAERAMPHSRVEADDDLMEWDYGAYEGRRTAEIEVERPGWRHCIHQAKLTEFNSYGFKASFNPSHPGEVGNPYGWWVSPWHYGLNQGPIILMIENYRTGLLCKLTRKCQYIAGGLRRAGFVGGWL